MEHTKLPCCSISPTIKDVYASQHEILVTALVNECCVKLIVIIRAISVIFCLKEFCLKNLEWPEEYTREKV